MKSYDEVSMVIMRSVSLSEKEMQKRAEEYKRLHPEIDMVPSRPTQVPASITATVSTTQDPTRLDSSTLTWRLFTYTSSLPGNRMRRKPLQAVQLVFGGDSRCMRNYRAFIEFA